jgi:hypothetical protein
MSSSTSGHCGSPPATEAGHPIDWTGLDPESNVQASRESHHGENEQLKKLLDGLIAD